MPERASPRPVAVVAAEAPARAKILELSGALLLAHAEARKRPLGDLFGLANFGVNLTRLAPGGELALRHAHTKQDEFVYVLEGGRRSSPTPVGRGLRRACARVSRPGRATRIILSTRPARTSSISRSATVRPATARPTRTTTSPRLLVEGRWRIQPQGRDALRLTVRAYPRLSSRYRRRGPWLRFGRAACRASSGAGPSGTAQACRRRSRAAWRSWRRRDAVGAMRLVGRDNVA